MLLISKHLHIIICRQKMYSLNKITYVNNNQKTYKVQHKNVGKYIQITLKSTMISLLYGLSEDILNINL